MNFWEKWFSVPVLRGKLEAFYQTRVPRFIKHWGPALLLMSVIFGFSSVPAQEIPNLGIFDLSVKKLGHATGYALLSLAYLRGLRDRTRRPYFLAWLMAVLYAATDEYHQSFVPGRGSTIADVGIDSIGAGLSMLVFAFLSSRAQGKGKD